MSFSDVVKTYRYYPKYISTLILTDYIAKHTKQKEKSEYTYIIDDLVFTYLLSEGGYSLSECVVRKNEELYDYFCVRYKSPEIKPDEIE